MAGSLKWFDRDCPSLIDIPPMEGIEDSQVILK